MLPAPRPVSRFRHPLTAEPAAPALHRDWVTITSTAIGAAGKPCCDNSTIVCHAASRHRPGRSASNISKSLAGPLANTQTGCILTTTFLGWTTQAYRDPTQRR